LTSSKTEGNGIYIDENILELSLFMHTFTKVCVTWNEFVKKATILEMREQTVLLWGQ